MPFPALNASALVQSNRGGKAHVSPKQLTVMIGT
jgi:hypothetical protein